jgi:lysophospholipase L1-like esterase
MSRFWLVFQILLFIIVGGFINGWHVPLAMATLSLQRASGCVTSVYVLEYTLFGDKQKIPFSETRDLEKDKSWFSWRQWVGGGLKNLGVVTLSIIVCLLGLEVVLRLADYRPLYDIYSKPDLFWQYDPLLGWAHEPNQTGIFIGPRPWPVEYQGKVHINSLGLRGPELISLPRGGYRVMVLGDSMVAGFEVDDDKTFVALLEEKLTKELRMPVQTINAGVRGYGTDQAYLYYRERVRELRPDLVIFQASGNDFEDNTTLHRARRLFGKGAFTLAANGSITLVGTPVPPYEYCSGVRLDASFQPVHIDTRGSRAACWLQTNLSDYSALFTFVTMRLRQHPRLIPRLFGIGTPKEQALDMSTHGTVVHNTPASRLTTTLIRELARTVRGDGARFLLSIAREDLALLDQEVLDNEGVEYFDLNELCEVEVNDCINMRYKNDGHMNEHGHARLADLMIPVLVKQLRAIAAKRDHL